VQREGACARAREGSDRVRSQGKHIRDTTSCRKHVPPIATTPPQPPSLVHTERKFERLASRYPPRTDLPRARTSFFPDRRFRQFHPFAGDERLPPVGQHGCLRFSRFGDARLPIAPARGDPAILFATSSVMFPLMSLREKQLKFLVYFLLLLQWKVYRVIPRS